MNTLYLYYNMAGHYYYDPRNNWRRVWDIALTKLDLIRIRLAITDGDATIDENGKPTAPYRVNVGDQVTAVFALKTSSNYLLEADGDLSFASAGFDTADTSWHSPSTGTITLAGVVIPLSYQAGQCLPEVTLFNLTGNPWTLDTGAIPLECTVSRKVFTGLEGTAPSGLPGGQFGTFTIAGSDTEAIIDIPGITPTGDISIGLLAPTGDPGDTIIYKDIAYCSTHPGQVRVYVTGAPGDGAAFNGNWTLLRL